MTGTWSFPPPTATQMRLHQIRMDEVAAAQRQLNKLFRNAVDNAALAAMPMLTGKPVVSTERYDAALREATASGLAAHGEALFIEIARDPNTPFSFINAKEDTMAARKKAKRPSRSKRPTMRETVEAMRYEQNPANTAAVRDPNAPTLADKLVAAGQPAKPSEAEAALLLLLPYALTGMGFDVGEIAALFGITTSETSDRYASGRLIAQRLGLENVIARASTRARLLRENQWADGARAAAKAMQERIVDALPAFVRAATGDFDDGLDAVKLVDLVKCFTPDDIVKVSKAAKEFKKQPQPEVCSVTGRVLGLAGDIQRAGCDADKVREVASQQRAERFYRESPRPNGSSY